MKKFAAAAVVALVLTPSVWAGISADQVGNAVKAYTEKAEMTTSGNGQVKRIWRLKGIPGGIEAIGNNQKALDSTGIHCGVYAEDFAQCRAAVVSFVRGVAPAWIDADKWFDYHFKTVRKNAPTEAVEFKGASLEYSNVDNDVFVMWRAQK